MIGIATYYTPINYGAVLQAFAMQEAIKEVNPNEEVGIMEYCPEAVHDDYKLLKTSSVKGLIISAFNYNTNLKRKKLFARFIDERICVIKMNDLRKVSQIILGSDQIWNPNISRGVDPLFFGIIDDGIVRSIGSYAASIGVSSLTDEQKKEFQKKINHVDYISVREKSAKGIIEEIDSSKLVSVDLDPTLLLDSKKWEGVASDYHQEKPYIFVYSLSGYTETYDIAKRVAAHYNAEILEVTVKNLKPFMNVDHKLLKCVSPDMFLGMIKGAEAVVTDSFHGTVFSLIFHKSLYVIPNKTKGSRMIELLQSVKLETRIITDSESKLDYGRIDYVNVDRVLESKKIESKKHLRASLNSSSSTKEDVNV